MKRFGKIVLTGIFAVSAASADESGPATLVVGMYGEFAWEALIDEPRSSVALEDAPREILERYFTLDLVDLILADRDCVKRTHELCRLNTQFLWDSQDPGATMLKVRQGKEPGMVSVSFVYPGDNQRISMTYITANGPNGWRISDIVYGSGWALRHALEQPL